MPARPHPRRDEILGLSKRGLTPKEISAQTGVCNKTVGGIVNRARKRGELPPLEAKRGIKYLSKKSGLSYGRVTSVIAELDIDQQRWLCDECTKIGAESVMEYLLELVRDAYEEARSKKNG